MHSKVTTTVQLMEDVLFLMTKKKKERKKSLIISLRMHLRKELVTRTGACDMYEHFYNDTGCNHNNWGGVGWGVGSCFLFVSVPCLKP